jgi:hypothetical protein
MQIMEPKRNATARPALPGKHFLALLVMWGITSVSLAEIPVKLPTPPKAWKDFNPDVGDDYLWYAIQRRVLSCLLAQEAVDKIRNH